MKCKQIVLIVACSRLSDNGGERKIGASEEKKNKWGLGMERRGLIREPGTGYVD